MKKILLFLALVLLPNFASAQLNTTQGGTGTTSPSGILYGDSTIRLKTVGIGSGLQFSGGTLSATGGGGGNSFAFPFSPVAGGNATSSLLYLYNGGYILGSTTLQYASSTAITAGNLYVGSLNGLLKATSGAVSTAIAGTDYEVPLTFSTGLTRSTDTVTVDTTQNIVKLSNLTLNGFIKTSNGDGSLSVDTNTYITGLTGNSLSKGNFIVGNETDLSQATSTVFLSSTGNFGVGTTSPSSKLQVVTTASATENIQLSLKNYATAIGTASGISFTNSTSDSPSAKIVSMRTGAGPDNDLDFYTMSSNTLSQRMTISSTGNVGIGTTTPGAKLDISQTDSASDPGIKTMLSLTASNNQAFAPQNSGPRILLNSAYNSGSTVYSSAAIYQQAQDTSSDRGGQLRFQTSNSSGVLTDAVTINKFGFVGVGTTSPSEMLQLSAAGGGDVPRLKLTNGTTGYTSTDGAFIGVSNSSQLDIWNFESNLMRFATANTVRMVIGATGNVGVGTSSPSAPFTVQGSGSVPEMLIAETSVGSAAQFQLRNTSRMWEIGSDSNPNIFYIQPEGGSQNVFVIDSSNRVGIGTTTPSGLLTLYNASDSRINFSNGSAISYVGSGANFDVWNSQNTPIRFATNNSQQMTLTAAGNLGIGTTSPAQKLDIYQSLGSTNALISINSAAVSTFFGLAGGGTAAGMGTITAHPDIFYTSNTERMRIDSTGNVGIGTSSPSQLLSVQGSGYISSNLFVGGNIVSTTTRASIVPYATTTAVSVSGELNVPNGTAPTITVAGDIAVDTTTGQLQFHDGTANRAITPFIYQSFAYATSSAWTGTTTIPLGPAGISETWSQAKCFTDAGTIQVSFNDGTNRMDWINASTTVGTTTLANNNQFVSSEKRYVDLGTPASSPTKVSCTIRKIYDSN